MVESDHDSSEEERQFWHSYHAKQRLVNLNKARREFFEHEELYLKLFRTIQPVKNFLSHSFLD